MFIDTHAHLSDELLRDTQEEIIAEFESNGIDMVIEVGCDPESSRSAVELAKTHNNVYAMVGYHPIVAETYTENDIRELEELAKNGKIVAIGEIGLDYHYDYDKALQKELFIRQLKLADKLGLPVVIHLRDAYGDMVDLLSAHKQYIRNGILFHCYSGSKEMVDRFSYLDPYYAFGGAITFKNNNRADVIKAIPQDRLLLETDCPYMTPVPHRGKVNNPNYIPLIAEKMGDALGISAEAVGEMTTANAKRFFRIGE